MMTKQTRHGSRPDVLKEFDRRLREQRARLTVDVRSDLEESEQSYSELVGEVRDSGDESNAALQADSEHAELFRHASALSDVDAALGRIRDGSFGACADCGREISIERLRAYPTAKRCLECQTRFEKQHTGNIGPSL